MTDHPRFRHCGTYICELNRIMTCISFLLFFTLLYFCLLYFTLLYLLSLNYTRYLHELFAIVWKVLRVVSSHPLALLPTCDKGEATSEQVGS